MRGSIKLMLGLGLNAPFIVCPCSLANNYVLFLFVVARWQADSGLFLLSRGTIGKDVKSFISTWNVRKTYKIKVLSATNCNVSDTMKVRRGLGAEL